MKIEITKNEGETKELAKEIAGDILSSKKKRKKATVVVLEGVLGAGKTTFTQGFAEGLGIKEDVKSPTFLILKEYKLGFKNQESRIKNEIFKKFYHIDCYRMEDEKDAKDTGIKEALEDPENIVLIEWGERIKKMLPKRCIKIKFYYISENKRKIAIS